MQDPIKQALLAQLYAIRAQAEAAIQTLASEPATPEPGCSHPEEKRIDCSTMGHPRFRCGACGEIVEQQQPSEVSE